MIFDSCILNGLYLTREMVGIVLFYSFEKVEIRTCVMLRSHENQVVIMRKRQK